MWVLIDSSLFEWSCRPILSSLETNDFKGTQKSSKENYPNYSLNFLIFLIKVIIIYASVRIFFNFSQKRISILDKLKKYNAQVWVCVKSLTHFISLPENPGEILNQFRLNRNGGHSLWQILYCSLSEEWVEAKTMENIGQYNTLPNPLMGRRRSSSRTREQCFTVSTPGVFF